MEQKAYQMFYILIEKEWITIQMVWSRFRKFAYSINICYFQIVNKAFSYILFCSSAGIWMNEIELNFLIF